MAEICQMAHAIKIDKIHNIKEAINHFEKGIVGMYAKQGEAKCLSKT